MGSQCLLSVYSLGPYEAYVRPYRDYVWPSFTSRPARALKFSTVNLHGLRTISIECLFFRTMSGPYKGHVWAILGPCFGYFYNIFASRLLEWLKFSLILLNLFHQKLQNLVRWILWNCMGICCNIGGNLRPL